MGPFLSSVHGADQLLRGVQLVNAMPFPDDFPVRGYLQEEIADHLLGIALVVQFFLTALNFRGQFLGDRLPTDDHDVAVAQDDVVVVNDRVVIPPHDVAVPVQLHQNAALAPKAVGFSVVKAAHKEVAVVPQKAEEGLGGLGRGPFMDNIPVHVDEPGIGATHGAVER